MEKTIKKKILLFIICALVISCIGLYNCFKSGNETSKSNIIDLGNSTGLIENIDPNYVFEVKNEDINFLDNDENVKLILKNGNNSCKLMPPKEEYLPFHFYKIILGKGNQFLEKDLSKFKEILFYVGSKDKTEVIYQDNVMVDNDGKYDGKILSTKKEYQIGQIVIVGEGKNCKALNIKKKLNNNIYRCDEADNIEDVYQSILINEHIENNFQYVETNEETILTYVKDNDVFDKIFPNVNALSSKDIDIKISKKGDNDPIGIEITIKHDNIIVNFKIGFSYTVDCKTKGISYISEKRNLSISLQLNIESENSHSLRNKITADLNEAELEEMYMESLKNQPAELNKVLDLFGLFVPIYGPVNLYTDFGWKNEISFQPNLEDNSVFKLDIEIGYGVKNGKLVYNYIKPKYKSNLDFLFGGQIEGKYGPIIEAGIDFMNGIRAGLEGQLGAYVDSYGVFKIDKNEVFLGHFELGGFTNVSFIVSSPITKSELVNIKLGEQRLIIKTFSNIINLKSHNIKDKYTYRDNGIYLGNLIAKFDNKLTHVEEEYKINNYNVYIDGKKYSSKKNKVNLPKEYIGGKHNIKITFKHNGKKESFYKDIEIVEENKTYNIYNQLLSRGNYQNETIDKKCRFLIYNLNNQGDEELIVINDFDFESKIKIYTNDFGKLEQIYDETLSTISLSVLNDSNFIIYNHIASDMNEVRICSFNDNHHINEEIYNFVNRDINETDWPWFNESGILLPEYEKCIDNNFITFYSDENDIIYSSSEFNNKYQYDKRITLDKDMLDNNSYNRNNTFNINN